MRGETEPSPFLFGAANSHPKLQAVAATGRHSRRCKRSPLRCRNRCAAPGGGRHACAPALRPTPALAQRRLSLERSQPASISQRVCLTPYIYRIPDQALKGPDTASRPTSSKLINGGERLGLSKVGAYCKSVILHMYLTPRLPQAQGRCAVRAARGHSFARVGVVFVHYLGALVLHCTPPVVGAH